MSQPIRSEKIDPNDYPFRHHIEAFKHLDNDENRHKIKPIVESIDRHYAGREHLFCDKEQLDVNGKFRRPKVLKEAWAAGYSSVMEYQEAKKKEEKEKEENENKKLQDYIKQLEEKNQEFADYKRQTEERFDKVATLLLSLQQSPK